MADIGIGMVGYGFMGRAHVNAYRKACALLGAPGAAVLSVAGRGQGVEDFARRWSVPAVYRDWRELIRDPRVQLVDCCGPHQLHPEVVHAALAAGKHILCEKPLALETETAGTMWRAAARAANLVHMTSFNYRFLPAVRLARDIVRSGALGAVREMHAAYAQQGAADPRRPAGWKWDRQRGGAGALLDLGVHALDLVRCLAGEPLRVLARQATFVRERPALEDPARMVEVSVDDACAALLELSQGALATLRVSRVAWGRKNHLAIEVHAERGSLYWDLERCNELKLCEASAGGQLGFRTMLVEPDLPAGADWWPPGHVYGWEDGFTFQMAHLLTAVAERRSVAPEGADFRDGYRAVAVAEAVAQSAMQGGAVTVSSDGV